MSVARGRFRNIFKIRQGKREETFGMDLLDTLIVKWDEDTPL